MRSPIDAFVLARLEKEGLTPSPEAPRETLLRRLSLDLVGLPPTPEEVDAFLADTRPDAYEKVVDRLLASPHYGERWARPWLDLARYADTNGYEKDQRRTAWRYRDWVIDALNRDLPFDHFTIEQLAGDLLPGRDASSRGSPPASTATRCSTRRAASTSEEFRFEPLVDRVNTTGTVWLGSTDRLRPVPQPQVRPRSRRRTTTGCSPSSTTASTSCTARARRSWTTGSSSPSWSCRRRSRRSGARRCAAEADSLRLEIDGRDLEAELAAFARDVEGPAPAVRGARAGALRGCERGFLPEAGRRLAPRRGRGQGEGHVRRHGSGESRRMPQAFRLDALPDPSLPQKTALKRAPSS